MIQLIVQTPPPHHGAALMNRYLVDAMNRSGIDIQVIPIEASREIEEIGRFSFAKLANALRILLHVFLGRRETRVVYLVMSTGFVALARDVLIVLLARLLGKKRVLHLRSKGFSKMTSINRWLAKRAFKGAYVIQHSPLLAADVEGFMYQEAFYIPNGWPDVYEQFQSARSEPGHAGPVNVLFFSNLMNDKGLFVALDAIGVIANEKVPSAFRVHFLGAWEDNATRAEFEQRVLELGVADYIGEVGPQYDDTKYRLLATMDFMIFPTFYPKETFGNVNIEAMMFKLPVISTFEGGIPDVVEDGVTGYLVPQQDADALAEKMKRLIDDADLRRAMGDAGRERYLAHFTIDKFEQKMLDLFTTL